MATVTKEYRLVMVDATENNNKIWIGKLFDNGDVKTEWGRVGAGMQSKDFPSAGESFLESKKREKEKKGYSAIKSVASNLGSTVIASSKNKDLEEVALRDIDPKCDATKKLIKHLIAENRHQIAAMSGGKVNVSTSGLVTTETGDVLSATAITEAKDLLNKMNPMIAKKSFSSDKFIAYIQDYLKLVPQRVGHAKGWHEDFFNSSNTVQKQLDLLESLEQSIDIYDKMISTASKTNTAKIAKVFNFSLTRIVDDKEIKRIEKFYESTMQRQHACYGMKITDIWEIDHEELKKGYQAVGAKMKNIMELWHGTQSGNVMSILNSGLKVSPPSTAAICGKMFGNGVYFSNISSKSLNYAYGYWQGKRATECFMLLNDTAMGNYQVPSCSTSKKPDSGYDSYWAKPGHSGIQNDELIVFNDRQFYSKYLVKFAF